MLKEKLLTGEVIDRPAQAIERIQHFEPPEGYYVAFSGGKDSIVILDLVRRAGVQYDAHYNLTTVDPPELVQFIKREYPKVRIERPNKTMWQLITENGMPPLRQMRYCCRILKERGGDGRFCITGVRAAESRKRAGRRMVETCNREGSGKRYLHPVIEWSDSDVWQYIHRNQIKYCALYDEGWKRLGCVMCPNANQKKQAKRWPKLAAAYKKACIKAYNKAIKEGKERSWDSGEEMYHWWISGQGNTDKDDQQVLFE